MKKKALAAVLVAAVTMFMAGCGSKTAETTGSEASSDAAGGTLVMATNAEFPPYEYYENEKVSKPFNGGSVISIYADRLRKQ